MEKPVMKMELVGEVNIKAFANVPQKKDEELIRTVAHDLRNPLGGISSLVAVLMEDNDLKTEQRDLLNLVKETANFSLNMVNELLEKRNQTFSEREPSDISVIINNCINLLQHKIAEKHQQLVVSVPTEGEMISISKDGIARLMDNLLSNAIKFTHEGGRICVNAIRIDNDFEITVQDNGIGIPDEMQKDLFKGCVDTGREGTAGEPSFGLGLSICKQIAQEHGGTITVASKVDCGTTFTVTFPVQAPQVNGLVA